MTGEGIAPVDGAAALALLEAAVETRGADYVYDNDHGCVYVRDGQPSCLVGVALAIHGVPLDVMDDWNAGIGVVVDGGPPAFIDGDARRAFRAAQIAQDNSETWGDALDAARAVLGTP